MSNFKLGVATIPQAATATANLTASTTRPIANLHSGSRSDRFELASSSTDTLTINYDLGASTTKTANFIALMRAKLLHRNDCTGIRLRGSTQSATLPSTLTPTAWFDPNRGVTTSSGAVSQWNDLSGNNYHATQGTAANRPLLSRADNQENLFLYSEELDNAAYTSFNMGATLANQIANPIDGAITADKLVENTANTYHTRYQVKSFISGVSYTISGYVKAAERSVVRVYLGDTAFPSYPSRYINLSTGASVSGSASYTVEDAGGGWWRISVTATAAASGNGQAGFGLHNGTTDFYLGDGASGLYVWGAQLRRSSGTDSTYIQTAAYPMWSGINGNRALVFDGSNDSLVTSLAVNPTGGMWAAVALKNDSPTTATKRILAATAGGATARLGFNIHSGGNAGRIGVYVFSSSANYIGRYTANNAISLGETAVLSFTYDGTTSATGIKIYKNGVQIDTTTDSGGVYAVPTSGDTLTIGSGAAAANPLSAPLPEVIFTQGATISAGNHTALVEYLTTKYITTPIVQLDSLSTTTLMGPNAEDYFSVFTETAAFPHWWLEFVNQGTASIYPCSKVLFGKALDFGREPSAPIELGLSRVNAWSREGQHTVDLKVEAVTDTVKETFLNEIAKYADVMPVVLLDPAAAFLRSSKGFHAYLSENSIEIPNVSENNINMSFVEQI